METVSWTGPISKPRVDDVSVSSMALLKLLAFYRYLSRSLLLLLILLPMLLPMLLRHEMLSSRPMLAIALG
jgi:hypothetical protein